MLLGELGQNSEAFTSFDKAIALEPDFAWLGTTADSLNTISDNIQKQSLHMIRQLSLHQMTLKCGITADSLLGSSVSIQKRLTLLTRLLLSNQISPEAWNNHGVAQYYLGQYTEAVASYDKAIAIDSDGTNAQENREIALQKQSQGQENKPSSTQSTICCYTTVKIHRYQQIRRTIGLTIFLNSITNLMQNIFPSSGSTQRSGNNNPSYPYTPVPTIPLSQQ